MFHMIRKVKANHGSAAPGKTWRGRVSPGRVQQCIYLKMYG